MIPTLREVVTIQEGGVISLRDPSLPAGAQAEVVVTVAEAATRLARETCPGMQEPPPAAVPPRAAGAVGTAGLQSDSQHTGLPSDPASKPVRYREDPKEYLFPEVAVAPSPPIESNAEEHEEELVASKQKLLADLAASELGTLEHKVAHILQQYLDTRDDDIALLIRYYETFQADVLAKWHEPRLDILYDLDNASTILRLRRYIQNDLDLFVGTLRTRYRRKEITRQFFRYMSAKSVEDPEIVIYLDETKGESGSRYIGVAGICVIDWRQYEMYHAALAQWRAERGWPETLHVRDQASEDITKHLSLLAALQKYRAGLLFVGHDAATRAVSHRALVDLFVQIVVGCLRHLRDDNCLGTRRAVAVIKEAEDGFDRVHLETLNRELQQQIAYEFADTAYLNEVTPIKKGREVMLEAADMIAAGMQRRALYGGWNSKDQLADAVANVTGFEDSNAKGVVYKAWYHQRPGVD